MDPLKRRSAKLPATDRPEAVAADVDAFALEMRDVVRLEPDPRGHVRSVAPISPPRHAPPRTEHADVSDHGFAAHGVDRREIRKLKRGEYVVRDRLDLHGMTGAERARQRATVPREQPASRPSMRLASSTAAGCTQRATPS